MSLYGCIHVNLTLFMLIKTPKWQIMSCRRYWFVWHVSQDLVCKKMKTWFIPNIMEMSNFYTSDGNSSFSSAFEDFMLSEICVARSRYVARMVIFALFVLFGVIGNLSLLVVILSDRQLRNAPNILICNLAVADFVYIVVTGPIRIEHEINPCWLQGEIACALKNYAPVVCQCACVYSLVVLSRERYTAITKGIHSRKSNQIRSTLFCVLATWIFGLIFAAPILSPKFSFIVWGLYCKYLDHGTRAAQIYEVCRLISLYIFPVITISVHYSVMAKTLMQSTKKFKENNATFTKQIEARKRLAYLSITLSICFGFFWLPSYIYTLMYNFMSSAQLEGDYMTKFRHFHFYMSLANSSLNPWLVFILSSSHRTRLLRCLRVKQDVNQAYVDKPRSSAGNTISLRICSSIESTKTASDRYS